MLLIDVLLLAALAAVTASNIRARQHRVQNNRLLAENAAISEHLVGEDVFPGENRPAPHPHFWSSPVKDVVYRSPLPWSSDSITIQTSTCLKCKMIHRSIIKGFDVADKRDLRGIEGFYMNGIKVPYAGCSVDNNSVTLDVQMDVPT